jgi:hypothetical protein
VHLEHVNRNSDDTSKVIETIYSTNNAQLFDSQYTGKKATIAMPKGTYILLSPLSEFEFASNIFGTPHSHMQ